VGIDRAGAHHVFEVRSVELLLRFFADAFERTLEAADRIGRALGVRIVAREQEQLWAGVADHAADVLAGKRREAHVAADVLGGLERQSGDVRIALAEDLLAHVERAQELRHPAGAELDHAAA
jgi:hypothetical protein